MHVDGGGVLCRAIIPHPLLYIVEDGPLLPACAAASIRCRPEHCLDKCPSELLDLVARNLLTGKDLVSFACVCRTTRAYACREDLWQELCYTIFAVPRAKPPPPKGWRALYKFNHEILFDVLLDKNLQATLDIAYPRLWSGSLRA